MPGPPEAATWIRFGVRWGDRVNSGCYQKAGKKPEFPKRRVDRCSANSCPSEIRAVSTPYTALDHHYRGLDNMRK